jgi:hypothetical protein
MVTDYDSAPRQPRSKREFLRELIEIVDAATITKVATSRSASRSRVHGPPSRLCQSDPSRGSAKAKQSSLENIHHGTVQSRMCQAVGIGMITLF